MDSPKWKDSSEQKEKATSKGRKGKKSPSACKSRPIKQFGEYELEGIRRLKLPNPIFGMTVLKKKGTDVKR